MRLLLFSLLLLCSDLVSTLPAARNLYEQAQKDAKEKRKLDFTKLARAGVFTTLPVNTTFDYVIIGGGTGGLAIAERLSENPAITVAVIEAGTFYQVSNLLLSSTPAGDVVSVGSAAYDVNPNVDWAFFTTPQTGANNRNIHYARGKCLGGSSARNFMIYQRGTVSSFDKWANIVNDSSFTFNNVLPYFKKSVSFTPPNTSKRQANATALYNASAFTPGAGPLHVSYANYAQDFDSYLGPALNQIGMPTATDFNSGVLNGVQYFSSTIDPANENRASSQETFLTYAVNSGRSNLKVYQLTMAKRILFSANKTAMGVVVQSNSSIFTLIARKEVILSAGAFQSPQMLMVSGIGPAATLQSFGIPVLVDNPNVGQNMWDHVFAGPSYRVNVQTFTRLGNDPAYIAAQYFGPYSNKQEGPLTNPVCDMGGWEKVPQSLRSNFTSKALSDLAQFPDDWPEIEYMSGAGYVGQFSSLLLTQPKDGYQYATLLASIVAPLSRGNVTISSADTNDLPIINPNWLVDPTDQQVAVAAFKRARQAFAAPALQKIVIGQEYFPGPQVATDAQILANYANTLLTVWHASCTCAMGTSIANGAVVDSHARVFGVSGLRVVDASAFPILPPGHPQSAVYMLAEKVAAQILAGQ